MVSHTDGKYIIAIVVHKFMQLRANTNNLIDFGDVTNINLTFNVVNKSLQNGVNPADALVTQIKIKVLGSRQSGAD